MNKNKIYYLLIIGLMIFLPGCSVIAGIFKAGFWTAIILIVIIVGLIGYGIKKMSGN